MAGLSPSVGRSNRPLSRVNFQLRSFCLSVSGRLRLRRPGHICGRALSRSGDTLKRKYTPAGSRVPESAIVPGIRPSRPEPHNSFCMRRFSGMASQMQSTAPHNPPGTGGLWEAKSDWHRHERPDSNPAHPHDHGGRRVSPGQINPVAGPGPAGHRQAPWHVASGCLLPDSPCSSSTSRGCASTAGGAECC
jgi:hypothetical protein